MKWRIAKCIPILVTQVNRKWPSRRKENDGTIGDTAHSSRASDHNPNAAGVVCAVDITHDPASGCDAYRLAQALLDCRDTRIKYVISNHRIASGSGGPDPWKWRPYHGSNPHDHHTHVSVVGKPDLYDDVGPWRFDMRSETLPPHDESYIAPLPTLKLGMRSDTVKIMQAKLGIVVDGDFGQQTLQALKKYQAAHNLVINGTCGPMTWQALGSPLAA